MRSNDTLAVQKHPTRYVAFAALPMQDPEAASRELTRCVKGGMISIAGNYSVRNWDEDSKNGRLGRFPTPLSTVQNQCTAQFCAFGL